MSDDEDHPRTDQFLGGSDRLLGVAKVVRADEPDLLPQHAASGIDIGHGLRRAALQLFAEPGVLAGQRARHADQDFRSSGPAEGGGQHDNGQGDQATHQWASRTIIHWPHPARACGRRPHARHARRGFGA